MICSPKQVVCRLTRSIGSIVAAAMALCFIVACGPKVRGQQSASIVVNATQTLGPVNRLVFGQNLEAADNAYIFNSNTTNKDYIENAMGYWDPVKRAPVQAVVNQCKAAGVSLLRYPGGCLVHNYDWRKTVGPDAKKNGWLFGLDEYMTLCRAVGAVPLITVSDYVLPADQMPANAAGLVEYLNAPATPDHPWAMKRKEWGHPAPYGVKYFELGNESIHGNHRLLPRRIFTAEQYASYANATAAAMRAVDPTIKIGIVMVPGDGTDVESGWNQTVARLAGKSADFLIIHLYSPRLTSYDPEAAVTSTEQSAHYLDMYRSMAKRESGKDLPLIVSEYNGIYEQRYNLSTALQMADLLRIFLDPQHHVLAAAYWEFLNAGWGMLRSQGNNFQSTAPLTVYQLLASHLGASLIGVSVHGPSLSVPASRATRLASGSVFIPRRYVGDIQLNNVFNVARAKSSNTWASGNSSAFVVHYQNLTSAKYPIVATFQRPSSAPPGPLDYDFSFDARIVPDPGSPVITMGVGLGDSRGFDLTHSGVGVDAISNTSWTHVSGTYNSLPDTKSIQIMARLLGTPSKPVSGQIEVRNLNVKVSTSPQFPAAQLETAFASLSADKKTLYLIVINKSANTDLNTALHVNGFTASSGRIWVVDGPSLVATKGVQITVSGASLSRAQGGAFQYSFPAHSISAVEFYR